MKTYENKEDLLNDFISTLNDLDKESDKTCSLRCNECIFKTSQESLKGHNELLNKSYSELDNMKQIDMID